MKNENCVLCNSEFTFMNAKVSKTKEKEGICRSCLKKLSKNNGGLRYSNYSKQELQKMLNGEFVDTANIVKEEQPELFSTILKIITGLVSIWLIYTALKYLLLN